MCILLDNLFPPDDAAGFGFFGSLAIIKKIINLLGWIINLQPYQLKDYLVKDQVLKA